MSRFHNSIVWLISLSLLLAVSWSWYSDGVVAQIVGSHDVTSQMEQIQLFVEGFGMAAPVVYVVLVTIEVVLAPIPGLMLYAPGGIIFGPVAGGALSLLGNVLGATIACSLTRSIGSNWLTRFFTPEQLDRMQSKIEARGAWWIFLLRLNPLTSSDIVSYAAGFTVIPIRKVVFATACGMAPLCFVQAWLADSLLTTYPQLLYPLVAVMVVYLLVVIVALFRMLSGSSTEP